MPFIRFIKKTGLRLARPDIIFWVLPFLMIILVVGTIAQKEIGIFAAQQTYFSSYFFMLGFVPLPGGLTLMSIFSVNLLAKFLFKSEWSWNKSGTILTHFGVLILVFGSLATYLTSQEGYLLVPEGETRNMVEDYHQRELVIRDGGKIILTIPHENLHKDMIVRSADLPFEIALHTYCFNCSISMRPADQQDGWGSPGKFMQLSPKTPSPQDEQNLTGIEFSVTGTNNGQDGKYLTFDKFPKPPQIKVKDRIYTIAIERATRALPFSVTLNSFKQDFHPGTDMARAYQSTVTIHDQGTSWPAVIEMNEPLRTRGFTLYQSSFDVSGDKPYTVLTVVENKGRLFPYISTAVIALGLILHLIIRLGRGRQKNA